MASRPPAIVVGLDCITGLQTARILAGSGVPVYGIVRDPKHFCARTRVCERILRADATQEAVIDALARLGDELDERGVLFPCTDISVRLISRQRDRLIPRYHVVLPSEDVVELLMDKASFCRFAQEGSLPIPPTRFLTTRADALEAAETLRYPCTLKPALKTALWERSAPAKAFKVSHRGEFLAVYDRCAPWADVLIAQEWIAGGEENLYSCNCYFDRTARPLVTFVARKLRQWPLETGTSSLGEECRNDIVMTETVRLFESVRFHGLGYVEMKRDERTGEHFIIEPNIGRPTGRSAIAEAGGVPLLYTAYCDAVGLPVPANLDQRYEGVKWIYWRADLQAAVVRGWRRELGLRDWLRSVRGRKVDAVFSWRDPLPFVLDSWTMLRTVVRAVAAALGAKIRRPVRGATSPPEIGTG